MAKIELKHLTKLYSNTPALENINLSIEEGSFVVVVGPSGSGKSTLLRLISGLEKATSGEVFIDGICVNDIPSNRRHISMVFQNYPLFEHLTIYENIAFGFKEKLSKTQQKSQINELAKKLSIDTYLNRYPNELSGGQKQRVGIARALISHPDIILMDEPLSNLDDHLRLQLRRLIKDLHQNLSTTFIYVTHDQEEALTLATQLVVLNQGSIQQIATPLDIYQHPTNQFVASFIGRPPMNFINASFDGKNICLSHKISIPFACSNLPKSFILGIRPEHINITSKDEGFPSTIRAIENLGSEIILHVDFLNQRLAIKTTTVPKETTIYIKLNEQFFHFFDYETKINLFKE